MSLQTICGELDYNTVFSISSEDASKIKLFDFLFLFCTYRASE